MIERAIPSAESQAALLAELGRRLRLDAGLAAILGGRRPLHDTATTVPGRDAHAALVADLDAMLNWRIGSIEILEREAPVTALVEDLSTTLDLGRGLIDIIGTSDGGTRRTRDEDAVASMGHSLLRLQWAPDHDRIQLRSAGPHRHLDAALRAAREIQTRLGEMDPHPDLTGTLVSAVEILRRQHALLAEAAAALAEALPNARASRRPASEPNPSVGELLAEARHAAGLTPKDLSNRIGWSISKISRIETGRVRPQALEIRAMGQELALTPEQIEDLVRRQEQSNPIPHAGSAMGAALRSLRVAAKLTQRDLAQRVDMSMPMISSIENGRTSVSFDRCIEICEALDATPDRIAEIIELGRVMWEQDDDRRSFALAEVGRLLRQSTDDLNRLGDQMAYSADTLSQAAHHDCIEQVDEILAAMRRIWAAISDFRGADLTAADVTPDLEDLDGVQWSDETASGGKTQWPDAVITQIKDHSNQVPGEYGIWEISLGTVAGPGAELTQMLG